MPDLTGDYVNIQSKPINIQTYAYAKAKTVTIIKVIWKDRYI